MLVTRALSLTFPVDRDDGPAHIISMPISQAVFETYFLAITKTYVALRENGPEWFMRIGPTVAALTLKTVAVKDDVWEGEGGVEQGLMAEIRRLTQVALPGPDGWSTIPFQEARDRKRLSPEDISEVENALVFFTVTSASVRRREMEGMQKMVAGVLDGSLISCSVTDFVASLPISTTDESIGAKVPASSIPR